jgi:pyridinium-3,5-bisthiocarboxylic acid mononucleotide nickel chelatase
MFVAALIDLGLPISKLNRELKKIPTLKFHLKASKKLVDSITATQFRVIYPRNEAPRAWKDIRRLIDRSELDARVKSTGVKIFTALAQAEAKIHGISVEKVHFHELGATDSIVDIFATAIGIHELDIDDLQFSPIPLGRGLTRSRHGALPLPGPATLELLKGLPTFGVDIDGETVTPTGAAIARTLGIGFGAQPHMKLEKIGYGTGQKKFPNRPNLFRLLIGDVDNIRSEEMLVLETNIDDMNPQYFDHVMDRLFDAGARDVFFTPIQMKKNRPATLLSVICELAERDKLVKIILAETQSIGVRYYAVGRSVLARAMRNVKTRYGVVRVKVAMQPDGTERATPEYDDLKRIAAAKNLPLKIIHDAVIRQLQK